VNPHASFFGPLFGNCFVSFCTAAQFLNIKWVHAVILDMGVCHTVDICEYEVAVFEL